METQRLNSKPSESKAGKVFDWIVLVLISALVIGLFGWLLDTFHVIDFSKLFQLFR